MPSKGCAATNWKDRLCRGFVGAGRCIVRMLGWNGEPGVVQGGKLGSITQCNPDSEWDWYRKTTCSRLVLAIAADVPAQSAFKLHSVTDLPQISEYQSEKA